MVERTKNSFIMLDSEELSFSHFIGSFRKNSLSGHHAECLRYRTMWLGREMPWNNYMMQLEFWAEVVKAKIPPLQPCPFAWQKICTPRKHLYKMVEVLLA